MDPSIAPASRAAAVTPNDTAIVGARALYIGTAGDVAIAPRRERAGWNDPACSCRHRGADRDHRIQHHCAVLSLPEAAPHGKTNQVQPGAGREDLRAHC